MKWTIGLPCYKNFTEVWFTVQALRMYHDLTDCEIILADNFGDLGLIDFCRKDGGGIVRHVSCNEIQGVSYAKNAVFDAAKGEQVLIMDSHILLAPGALDFTIEDDDLYQGPCLKGNGTAYGCEWLQEWRRRMWGVWAPRVPVGELPSKRWEIWAQGAGFFACRRESWLGFNKDFRGFGAETGYIQEKYRKNGRKVWCEPSLIWQHYFCSAKSGGRPIPYPLIMHDRIRNFLLAFKELEFSPEEIILHFGKDEVFHAVSYGIKKYNDENLLTEYVNL